MGLPDEEASKLHHRYYSQYGLAIRGLVRHHKIGQCVVDARSSQLCNRLVETDPLDFDRKCDGSLPLEELLKPDPVLRKLLQDIDRSKVRVWGLTNAYHTVRVYCSKVTCSICSHEQHASRVLRILGVDDLVEGIAFCDYSNPEFNCKPEPEFYHNVSKRGFDPKLLLIFSLRRR